MDAQVATVVAVVGLGALAVVVAVVAGARGRDRAHAQAEEVAALSARLAEAEARSAVASDRSAGEPMPAIEAGPRPDGSADTAPAGPAPLVAPPDRIEMSALADSIVEGLVRVANLPPATTTRDGQPVAPYRIYNIGNNQPVELLEFIRVLERHIGRTARLKLLPMQPGDVLETYADIADLTRDTGFKPSTTIEQGLDAFVNWYRQYASAL